MENLLEESKLNTINLNQQALVFLKEIAKWSYFIGILGFIGVGLMVILAFSMGSILSNSTAFAMYGMAGGSSSIITVVYLLFAVLYFFPVFYLFKFSVNLKQSLNNKSEETLTDSLEYLKSHYKFIGILAIVMIAIYALIFLFAFLAAAFI